MAKKEIGKAERDELEGAISAKIIDKLQEVQHKKKKKLKKNFMIVNELEMGNYFGEIGAISQLRRTCSVVAINSMLIGKIRISLFKEFASMNSSFISKIRKKVESYKD